LVPGIGDFVDPVPDPSPVVVGEAVLRLLSSIGAAAGGALLVLEDLQWADPETLEIVEFLADHARQQPVLVAVAIRTGAPDRADSLARSLRRRRISETIELAPLTQDEVQRMAAACLQTATPPPAIVQLLWSRSDGVPLLVEELLLELAKARLLKRDRSGWTGEIAVAPIVPSSFAEAIGRRVGDLERDH
ncbi:MAG: hypothetical protein QOK40_67, partial [Miltoncostaeaceae bacterium]|nr:hypothetical protein [Miltoncostaeaceae bacterium]